MATQDQASSDQTLKRRKLWVVVAACIAAIGLVAGGGARYLRSGRTVRIDSIAVLAFTNGGGDANTDYLSDGITESLIANLTHVPELTPKWSRAIQRERIWHSVQKWNSARSARPSQPLHP
jgi:hypothetical protein